MTTQSRSSRYTPKPGDKKIRIPRVRPWRIILPVIPKQKSNRPQSLILIYGFLGLIAIGTIILMLPISSKSGHATSFVDALFTSTSAVCVTGLVVADTANYWNLFGQIVILVLIQLGGFGFMTSATLFLLAFGRRIGLRERLLIGESMGLSKMGGLTSIVKRMAVFTLIIEAVGVLIFLIRFTSASGFWTALWQSIFHSVSAFNNAGFDIFGNFSSLSAYNADPLLLLVTAGLIILGGISFLVVTDIIQVKRFTKLSLDSKLVLFTTLALLIMGTIIVLLTEFRDPDTLGAMTFPQKVLNAFFQSVTARTAGFSSVNVANIANYALFFTMMLMFIGGASGSTAGGIKVNNFGMLAATIWSTLRGKEHAGAFNREFTTQHIHRALTVVLLSLGLISVVVFLLTITEEFRFLDLLFETVSAFGTVGLSTGITPGLTVAGRLIITITMFVGRLGPLTLMLALIQRQYPATYRYPEETVRIG